MSAPILLRGMTWAHTRGFLPLVATAQRYQELNPEVEIVWEKRSLADFEHYSLAELAARYDLLVIDHPFVGGAAERGLLLPLDDLLPADFLADQAANSVGASAASYVWAGRRWALAIDAAAPVAAWRPDLLAAGEITAPRTWAEVLALARRGAVEAPAVPINCLMNFFGLCATAGEAPFARGGAVVGRDAGRWALQRLRELVAACGAGCLTRNPIQSLELLASAPNRTIAFCLFPYGYSNYAREGYGAHRLVFGDLPSCEGRQPLVTTLGGTGLALSARTAQPRRAADYAAQVAGAATQRTIYTRAGGQPGHRLAWLDAENNRITHGYFTATLPALDRAYLRPRYDGYIPFQEHAAQVVHAAVQGALAASEALARLDVLYREAPATAAARHA